MISVVNEIPILKSTIQAGTGTSRDVIQNIDRVDVGVKLKLTPHVVPNGDVQMTLNTSIEAVIDPGPAGTSYTPTIAKREVNTAVVVPDGQQIIIAGLTREDKTQIDKRIPILGSIPLLGWLFSSKVDTTENTNILILVTPRVVSDMASANQVKAEWEQKASLEQPAQK
jgi:general secretion pathway protein D